MQCASLHRLFQNTKQFGKGFFVRVCSFAEFRAVIPREFFWELIVFPQSKNRHDRRTDFECILPFNSYII